MAGSLERIPGIQALSWNPIITREERAAFEGSMQRGGHPQFVITERNRNDEMIVAGSRSNYVVVQYIEPYLSNEKALGYDIYSNPARKLALDQARDSGLPIATASIKLVQEENHQSGILVFLPIYQEHTLPIHIEDRHKALHGYIVGVFRAGDILVSAMRGFGVAHTEVLLIDETKNAETNVLAAYKVHDDRQGQLILTSDAKPSQNKLTWSNVYDVGSRSWRLVVNPTSLYLVKNRSLLAWFVLASALLVTALLGTFLLLLAGQAINNEKRATALAMVNTSLSNEVVQREKAEASLRHANKSLEHLATVDYLTGAYNRRYIHAYGKRCDAELQRYHQPYSIILIDVDYFKLVNDQFGHIAGDATLHTITERVADQLRETDCLGRWGGEEFIVIAKQTGLEECIEIAHRLCRVVNDEPVGQVGNVSISIGVACNSDSSTLEEIVKKADQALYIAKEKGRNRVEFVP